MTIKPFTVDGNIVVNEATITNDGTSIILPSSSTIDGGGNVLDATNSTTDDLTEGVTNLYFTDARADARIALQAGANLDLSGKSTTDLAEGTNLYYTQGRFDTAFTAKSTTDLSEGTNLYYTDARVQTYIGGDRTHGNITADSITLVDTTNSGVTDADPTLTLYRNSPSPSNNDQLGQINFTGRNDNSEDVIYAQFRTRANVITDSSESGNLFFRVMSQGTLEDRLALKGENPTQFQNQPVRLGNNSTAINLEFNNGGFITTITHGATANQTITLPDATGTVALTSQLYTDSDVATYISGNRTYGNITTTGYIAGPATFTIDPAAVGDATGTVVILGDLQVDGTTTTINSTTLDVDDLNITVASGAANAAAANGAGLTVDGAGATLTYNSANDRWAMNKSLDVTGTITADGLTVDGTAVEVVSINSTQNGAQISFDSASTTNDWSIGISNSADGDFLIYQNAAAGAGDLRLYTNGQERLTILSGGDVGIDTDTLYVDATNNRVGVGTTAPATALDVTGTVTADGLNVSGTNDVALIITNQSNYTEGLTIRNTANWGYGSSVSFESKTSDGGSNAEVGRIQSTWNAAGYHGLDFYALNNNTLLRHMRLDGSGDFSLYDDTGVNAKFFWDASAESLGIGTDSPVELLHANGSIRLTTDVSTTRRLYALSGTGTYALNSSGGAAIAFHRDATNNDEIAFETHWQGNQHAERMRIDNQGNVGIGTSTPDTILEIVSSNPILTLRDTSTGFNNGDATLRLAESGAGDTLGGYFDVRLDASMLKFDFTPEGGSVSTYMAINSSDGNVGIGHASPSATLDVVSNSASGYVAEFRESNASNFGTIVIDSPTDGESRPSYMDYATGGTVKWSTGLAYLDTARSFHIGTGSGLSNSKVTIKPDGNVGIGTTSPNSVTNYKTLHIDGTVGSLIDMGASNLESRIVADTNGLGFQVTPGSHTHQNIRWKAGQISGAVDSHMILLANGNVGIGDNAPAGKLEVENTSVNYAILGTSNKGHYFESQSDDNTDGFEIYQQHGSNTTRNSFIVNDNRTGSKSAALVVRGDGNVGIGTSSPGRLLTLFNNDQPVFQITNNTSGLASTNGMIFYQASGSTTHNIDNQGSGSGGDIQFMAAGSNTLKIQANGNVGIGTSSPDQTLHVHKGSAGTVASHASSVLTLENSTTNILQFLTPNTAVQQIRFGDPQDDGAGIIQYDHSTSVLQFNVNGPERMRIDSSGNLLLEHTDFNTGWGVNNRAAIAVGANYKFWSSRNSTTSRGHMIFYNPNGNVGSITTDGSATLFNTSSDYRLKENVADISDGITRVKQLAPKRFNFIADANKTVDGFLAHEAQTVVPEAVTGAHNGLKVWQDDEELPDGVSVGDNKLDADGNTIPEYQGIDQAKLVPLLTAALKESIAKIEALEARVTALES